MFCCDVASLDSHRDISMKKLLSIVTITVLLGQQRAYQFCIHRRVPNLVADIAGGKEAEGV